MQKCALNLKVLQTIDYLFQQRRILNTTASKSENNKKTLANSKYSTAVSIKNIKYLLLFALENIDNA